MAEFKSCKRENMKETRDKNASFEERRILAKSSEINQAFGGRITVILNKWIKLVS